MSTLNTTTIVLIGAGTMGQALLKGLLAHGVQHRRLRAADAHPATRRQVHHRFGIAVSADARAIIPGADVVILSVKPQQFPDVVRLVRPILRRRQLVISIAAGIRLAWLGRSLPGIPLMRVMPNLPAIVGCGFSALATGRGLPARHRAIGRAIFSAVGDVVELPERHFDAVTAVSGSGPAYVFFLVQAWQAAAKALGLPADVAGRAIGSTLGGSLCLLSESRDTPEVLIAKVASKGGTTEAALKVLARRQVLPHFVEALRAAAKHSRQLSWS